MTQVPAAGIERLMFFVQHRLTRLGWSRDDLCTAGGPSSSTLRKMVRAQRIPTAATLMRLEFALGWQPGSAQGVLAGGEPENSTTLHVNAASSKVKAALARPERDRVAVTAQELKNFLLAIAEELDAFYTEGHQAVREDASARTS